MAPYPTDDEQEDPSTDLEQEEPSSALMLQWWKTPDGRIIVQGGIAERYEVLGLALENPHEFFSFSEEEARRLVSSAGLPLFGRIPPEKYHLLDPAEALLERSMFKAGCFGDDLCICRRPWDIYDLLELLVDQFTHVDTRTPRALSQANIEHVATVTKRLRTLIQALEDPVTQLFSGGKPMEDFVRDCKEQLVKFNRWASILDRTEKVPGGDQTVEEFIRGPLADVYDRLFHREAGGNEKGPFARFGACFFEMAGNPIAPATIVRALKEQPRTKKKRRHLHLVRCAA
jgi:hypothetical protein